MKPLMIALLALALLRADRGPQGAPSTADAAELDQWARRGKTASR